MNAALRPAPRLPSHRSLIAAWLLFLAGCGTSGDDSSFVLRTTAQAAAPAAALVVSGDWLVYLASEGFTGPAGTDLNGDGDTLDDVAVVVNLRSTVETTLGVAAAQAAVLGDEVYLVVDESADGTDWSGDTLQDDLVLLHWSDLAGSTTFVDLIDADEVPVVADERLFYSSDGPDLGVADETTLRALDETDPTDPEAVLAEVGGLLARGGGPPEVHAFAEDEGLLFCYVDETADGVDYNTDLDATDPVVLVLLDATDPVGRLKNVELALADDDAPVDADLLAAHDWRAAFLVDEAGQGNTNLNDQALFSQPLLPENCLGTPDGDTGDQVLFYLEFADFLAGTAAPVNTGLAGHDRVLSFGGFVATISDEAGANCNLNAGTGDADTGDDVARWVEAVTPIAPAREADQLHALAIDVKGGSMGLSVLDDRLIAVVDEAADDSDLDGKAADHELVGWLDPAVASAPWHFSHQAQTNGCCEMNKPDGCFFGTGVFDDSGCTSEPFAGTSWMAAEAVGDRLGLVFLEEVPGTNPDIGSLNVNLDCARVIKDSDKTDGLPVWADFETGPTLDFDGVAYAVDKNNPGIEIAGAFVFFRVSEADDNRDYNADGDKSDVVLFRNPLAACSPVPMATSSSVTSQVVTTDRSIGAAFLASESQAGIDFNDDGDTGDLVVRYFLF